MISNSFCLFFVSVWYAQVRDEGGGEGRKVTKGWRQRSATSRIVVGYSGPESTVSGEEWVEGALTRLGGVGILMIR